MYAVIFKARVKALDDTYIATASRLRDLAMNQYGCTEFTACSEGDYEIAISYWPSKQAIVNWKNNEEHKRAQALGISQWYQSYQVQIVEVLHDYERTTAT